MAITVSYTVQQVIGAPQNIVMVDTSTGSDAAAVSRRIYLRTANNTHLVPSGETTDYIEWPLLDGNTITLDVLDKDYALSIILAYVNVGGSLLYAATTLDSFTLYNESFYYSLTQAQASQSNPPPIIQDTNYYSNKLQLRTLIDSGNQALSLGADIVSAQNCYNMATALVAQQNLWF
jgi:hypothetical protein